MHDDPQTWDVVYQTPAGMSIFDAARHMIGLARRTGKVEGFMFNTLEIYARPDSTVDEVAAEYQRRLARGQRYG